MPTKPTKKVTKRKPKRQPKEDFNQATFRVMQEVIRRSESASDVCAVQRVGFFATTR